MKSDNNNQKPMTATNISAAHELQTTIPENQQSCENSIDGFLSGIDMTPIDWDSIDTSKVPEDCDKTSVVVEFEHYLIDIPDDVNHILVVVEQTEAIIKACAKELNKAMYNKMKNKVPSLVKLVDEAVFQTIIDSTIKYKNSRHLNDLYSLYRRLSDKDIRKFCRTEIHSLYVQQIRKSIAKKNKANRAERNTHIFECIDAGMRYADIAAKFSLSEATIKKLAQKHKHLGKQH